MKSWRTNNCCSTCAFFARNDSDEEIEQGKCQRHPPNAGFPMVHETDWCGEWRPTSYWAGSPEEFESDGPEVTGSPVVANRNYFTEVSAENQRIVFHKWISSLSTRSRNAIKNLDPTISTLSELVERVGVCDLLDLTNCGKTSVYEITASLALLGITLMDGHSNERA